jgi:predicted ATP-binding protein involved in virulence
VQHAVEVEKRHTLFSLAIGQRKVIGLSKIRQLTCNAFFRRIKMTAFINSLKLNGFRSFETFEIDFHPEMTVLIAENGGGKTSVLDALAIAIGPFIGGFDEGIGPHFHASDIRLNRVRETVSNEMEYAPHGVRLSAEGSLAQPTNMSSWSRELLGPSKSKTTVKDAKALTSLAKELQIDVRSGNSVVLPLIAYYGTNRLWQAKKLTHRKLEKTSRLSGYTDCLQPGSTYKFFCEWFRYWSQNSLSLSQKAIKEGIGGSRSEFDDFIQSVVQAITSCLEPSGWCCVDYDFGMDELVALHPTQGKLPVSQLSDGVRNMIGLVADIAFRATKLNPHLGTKAALETPGLVMIDEVDMHLHPSWQQTVLASLRTAFPNLQFIVTTHSPQVLSTAKRENIRILGTNAEGQIIASQPLGMTYGQPSGEILHGVMMVNPQPPISETEDLQALTVLIDQGNYKSNNAKQLLQKLTEKLGQEHPQLLRLQRSIARQILLTK